MGLNALFIYFYGAQCPWLSIFIGRFSPLDQPNWMSKPTSDQSIMITKSEIQAQQVADEKQQILGRQYFHYKKDNMFFGLQHKRTPS